MIECVPQIALLFNYLFSTGRSSKRPVYRTVYPIDLLVNVSGLVPRQTRQWVAVNN